MTDVSRPEWRIERLAKPHVRAGFDCGNPSLSAWLKEHAGQSEERDLARVYVAVRPGQTHVLGYYAISACQVRCGAFPAVHARKVPPRMDVPAILLGKLAVDRSVHGEGLGSLLLVDAQRRALGVAEKLGVLALVVDAIDDNARAFYEHYGFIALLDDPRRVFVTMTMLRRCGLPPVTESSS